ncbi:MAG: SgcJ/EcaC family oxidoreductase [Anaerolineales bacterium]|nr:SgcJ/EcaC family oxidoreductase [Anaerolineales bacterium]
MLTTDAVKEKDAVQSVLDAWIAGVEQGDLDLIARVVAPDEDTVWIGVSADERLEGWTALRAALAAQDAALADIRIEAGDTRVRLLPGGAGALATSAWTFTAKMGEQAIGFPLRCTWVLEKRGDVWLLVHFHKSVGVAL